MTDSPQNIETRFGFCAVVGEPNAGKSTLINKIIGTKVSIVSPKAQTTRTRVLGVAIEGNAQIVFVDTPGIFEASKKNKMERAIVASAWEGIADAEIVILLVDVSKKIGHSTELFVMQNWPAMKVSRLHPLRLQSQFLILIRRLAAKFGKLPNFTAWRSLVCIGCWLGRQAFI